MLKIFFKNLLLLILLTILGGSTFSITFDYESTKTLPAGLWEIGVGLEKFERSDKGTFVRLPSFLFKYGLSNIADISLKWDYRKLENAYYFSNQEGAGDVRIKIKLVPFKNKTGCYGVSLETKLPDASDIQGLGTDQMDFIINLLSSIKRNKFIFHLNLGFGILGRVDVDNKPELLYQSGLNFELLTSRNNIDGTLGPFNENSGQEDVAFLNTGFSVELTNSARWDVNFSRMYHGVTFGEYKVLSSGINIEDKNVNYLVKIYKGENSTSPAKGFKIFISKYY